MSSVKHTLSEGQEKRISVTCAVSHCLQAAGLLADAKKGVKKCKEKKRHKPEVSECPVFTCLPLQKPKIKSLLWTGLKDLFLQQQEVTPLGVQQ